HVYGYCATEHRRAGNDRHGEKLQALGLPGAALYEPILLSDTQWTMARHHREKHTMQRGYKLRNGNHGRAVVPGLSDLPLGRRELPGQQPADASIFYRSGV